MKYRKVVNNNENKSAVIVQEKIVSPLPKQSSEQQNAVPAELDSESKILQSQKNQFLGIGLVKKGGLA